MGDENQCPVIWNCAKEKNLYEHRLFNEGLRSEARSGPGL